MGRIVRLIDRDMINWRKNEDTVHMCREDNTKKTRAHPEVDQARVKRKNDAGGHDDDEKEALLQVLVRA